MSVIPISTVFYVATRGCSHNRSNNAETMASTGILPESLQTALHELVDRVNGSQGGIRVILLSTSEGVPLGRIPADTLDEQVLASLESTWAPAPKQFPLLKLGKIQTVTAMYTHATLLHVYQSPVVVTIVLSPNANLGAIRSTAIPLLNQLLAPLCETLLSSLSPSREYQDIPQQGYYQ